MDKLSNEKINKIVDVVLKQCNIFRTNLPRSTSARNALLNYTKTYNEYEGVKDYRTMSPIFGQTKTIFNKSITNAYNKRLDNWSGNILHFLNNRMFEEKIILLKKNIPNINTVSNYYIFIFIYLFFNIYLLTIFYLD